MPRLAVGSSRTQTVCGDAARERGRVLTPLGSKALGRRAFPLMLVPPLTVHHGRRHARHDHPLGRRDERGAHQLRRLGDGPVAGHPVST